MVRFLGALSAALKPFRTEFECHLLLDVAPCHLVEKVFKAAKAKKIKLIFVPAKLSPIVQPLDTHAYSVFKHWLERKHQQLRDQYPDGLVPGRIWLGWLLKAPEAFFSARQWAPAFDAVGATGKFECITRVLRQHMKPQDMLRSDAPLPEDLALVWPKRRRMAYAHSLLFT